MCLYIGILSVFACACHILSPVKLDLVGLIKYGFDFVPWIKSPHNIFCSLFSSLGKAFSPKIPLKRLQNLRFVSLLFSFVSFFSTVVCYVMVRGWVANQMYIDHGNDGINKACPCLVVFLGEIV